MAAEPRILNAMGCLSALSRCRAKDQSLLPHEVDAELVPAMWKHAVFAYAKLPQGEGPPRRVGGVRPKAAALCPEPTRRVHLPVEPVEGPVRPFVGRAAV